MGEKQKINLFVKFSSQDVKMRIIITTLQMKILIVQTKNKIDDENKNSHFFLLIDILYRTIQELHILVGFIQSHLWTTKQIATNNRLHCQPGLV